ncbi:sensor histidine kinase [Hymenobacter cavernae]|uniref:histidine kinase n=1 Tax=Hymenobacter cavernae TaxID=2044852 RepID=A0ABQ1TL28_9BACT|nr:ATP-binding protein [Hymenobacter cavernae]GGE95982.1 hypothetical protein GCM10011383_03430 [Hymenobacter cavernae]
MLDYLTLFKPLGAQSQVVYFSYHLATRRLVHVSPAYQRVFGSSLEQAPDELAQLLSYLHPDDREYVAGCVQQLGPEQLAEEIELRLRYPDGHRQWLSLTLGRVRTADGEEFLSGYVQDITRLKAYMDNADKFNAKKNATLEILSHDLAGPLLLVQQLAAHVDQQASTYNNPELKHLLGLMQKTCQESVDLIRDFVNQEFMESSNVELKLERIDLIKRLRWLLNEYQSSEQNIDKHFEFRAPDEPLYLLLDDNKFQQVMNNLLSNAIKFTYDGGHITVSVEPQPHHVLITVSDDGIGIPEKFHSVLFDKFTKARRPGLRDEKTTGLGMSIIKLLVELHDGRIWFASTENQGTTFFIRLPIREPHELPASER